MSEQFSDFGDEGEIDGEALEDFQIAPEREQSMLNTPSNINYAANTVLLESPELAESSFRHISAELNEGGASVTADKISALVKEKQTVAARNLLVTQLRDSNLTDKEKSFLADAFMNTQAQVEPIQQVTARESIISESPGESKEQAIVRLNFAGSIQEVDEYNKLVQTKINEAKGRNSPGFASAAGDFLGILMPFVDQVKFEKIREQIAEGSPGKTLALFGESRSEIVDAIRVLPLEKRAVLVEAISNMLGKHEGITTMDENDFTRLENMRILLEDGYYDDVDRFVDDAVSVLDSLGVLGALPTAGTSFIPTLVARGARAIKGLVKRFGSVEEAETVLTQREVRNSAQSTTPATTLKDTNPGKARVLHETVAGDTTGEAAQAGYGTSRTEAIANDLVPEVGNKAGSVKNKVGSIDDLNNGRLTPDSTVVHYATQNGAIYYSKQEKIKERARIVNDFQNATGIHSRDEMFQSQALDKSDGVRISAVYGPKEGGWSNKDDALALVQYALRGYGVDEKNVQLLRNLGGELVPWKKGDPDTGMYLVKVDMDYSFNPADIVAWQNTDVKRNWFDRVPFLSGRGKAGSVQRHVLDPHSMLDGRVTLGANVGVDRTIGLERALANLGTDFSKGFAKLPKQSRDKLESLIKEANHKGIDVDDVMMDAQGFGPVEKRLMKKWRESWDTHYWLENRDLAKTLRNQGWGQYVDKATDTQLFTRPFKGTGKENKGLPQGFGDGATVYNPTTGGADKLSRDELKAIYQDGGVVAQLRNPIEIGGKFVDKIVSKENATDGFIRALNLDDQVLNYRKGYYQVHYKDPKFIIKRKTDSSGRVIEQAIATAPDTKTAEMMVSRNAAVGEEGVEYFWRADKKTLNSESDDYWAIQSSAGRTAQRTRGERLEDATTPITDPQHDHILDPVAALTKSIRGVARRTSMRDYLDATKRRFLEQYKDVLPKDEFQRTKFPEKMSEIGGLSRKTDKRSADARTMFEYLNYLEGGYVNAIDDGWKSMLNWMADETGALGLTKSEQALNFLAGKRPTSGAKGAAFKLYLAANPLRQLIVQSHQAVRLTAMFPEYMGTGQVLKEAVLLAAARRGVRIPDSALDAAGMTRKEVDQMAQDYNRSGLAFAVDANNLVRSDLKKLADVNLAEKLNDLANVPLNTLQKVGFDAGEGVNIATAWLAHRNAAIKAGRKLDVETMDDVAGMARNFTYNMNLAGDMPYNQNMVNVLMQFMQVPHKAILQYTNRNLTGAQRARLAAFDGIMFGVPTGAITAVFGDILPEDPELRRAISNGLEEYVLNKSLSLMYGEPVATDWSGLAPSDMHGFAETFYQIFTDPVNAIAKSPSGQLWFGNNARITNAMKTAAGFFHIIDDGTNDPVTFSETAMSIAKLSSGFSNAYKAEFALRYGQKMNTMETRVLDSRINTVEAIAVALGFSTITEAQNRKISMELYEKSKAFDDDVKAWYDSYMHRLSNKSNGPKDIKKITETYTRALEVWKDTPKFYTVIDRLIKRDATNGDKRLMDAVFKATGFMKPEDLKSLVKDSGQPERNRLLQLKAIDLIAKARRD